MRIYLDNCCFNRPFDDQSQLRIKLEAEAKLEIQRKIQEGELILIWSFILDFENEANPFEERRRAIQEWRKFATEDLDATPNIRKHAIALSKKGIHSKDALHISCACAAKCLYFLTTDDKILKMDDTISELKIIDPIGFIKEITP